MVGYIEKVADRITQVIIISISKHFDDIFENSNGAFPDIVFPLIPN
jgi:hypothetical protein